MGAAVPLRPAITPGNAKMPAPTTVLKIVAASRRVPTTLRRVGESDMWIEVVRLGAKAPSPAERSEAPPSRRKARAHREAEGRAPRKRHGSTRTVRLEPRAAER